MIDSDNQQPLDLPDLPHRGFQTGTFVDGKTTEASYLIIAVRKGEDVYNCVGIKRIDNTRYKYHFWPSDEFFGVSAPEAYLSSAGMSRCEYVGGKSDWDGVVSMLALMEAVEGTSVATPEKVLEAYNAKYPVVRSYNDQVSDNDDEDDEYYDGGDDD